MAPAPAPLRSVPGTSAAAASSQPLSREPRDELARRGFVQVEGEGEEGGVRLCCYGDSPLQGEGPGRADATGLATTASFHFVPFDRLVRCL